ncbi:hypothetical protein [Streptomyces sp. NBC_01314]|nr:hypothetical protein OG622_42425 [Streptomyces sp. NBC_01314]
MSGLRVVDTIPARSNRSASSQFSSAQYIVGTPAKKVTRSRSMSPGR